ncbi:hypothetical protein [Pedobacter aquatilis]|uniref:hypothetical protein n=1 Tax=Pedobacter aquatilis TaxID=351343 RepID=UPI00292F19FF|nr:hypothetical protein [Pedobacter aquatilis]
MRKLLFGFILLFTLSACKKSIPPPNVIKLNVFTTKILNTNTNEPQTLYWYVRFMQTGGLYYCTSTNRLLDFKGYKFTFSIETPNDLKAGNQIEDIVVYIRNLEGDIVKDFN